MNINSFFLILIVFFISGFFASFKKIRNILFQKYIFWLITSIFFLVYFLIFRFINDWINLNNLLSNLNILNVGTHSYSIAFSKALFLDLCPFLAFALPISLILDKRKIIANILSPFAIFGGLITLVGGILFDKNADFNFEYIFLGIKQNEIYFIMHAYLLITGIFIFVSTNRYKYIDTLYQHLFAILYFSYIIGISRVYNVNWNVTGTVINDWLSGGEYHTVSILFKIDYPYILFLSYFLVYIFINSLTIANIYIMKKKQKIKIKKNIFRLY